MKKLKILILLIVITGLFNQVTEAKVFNKKTKAPKKVEKPVTYTVNSARQILFKNTVSVMPQSEYKSHLTDKLYSSNMYLIEKNMFSSESNNTPRNLFPSYCGNMFVSYGIRYHKSPERVWVYNSNGKLIRIEFDNNIEADVFPRTALTYNNKGMLSGATLYVSKSDQYNFDGKGNLIVHWVGTKAYNRSGKLMRITRQL